MYSFLLVMGKRDGLFYRGNNPVLTILRALVLMFTQCCTY